MRSWAKWLCVLALTVSVGGHWALLQCVAWSGMLLQYSQTMPLAQAVAYTFDGDHPCKMCRAISQGQQDEKQQAPAASSIEKSQLFYEASTCALLGNKPWQGNFCVPSELKLRTEQPPRPRPRWA